MNIFCPQTIQTQVELEEIACVERQIISPSTSKSANGTKQDGLVGGYNLSHPTLKVGWRTAMNLITYTTVEDFSKIPKKQDLPGAKLYSMIVPPEINLNSKKLKIKNGEIVDGRVTNDALGAKKSNTLTQLIWDEYGVDETENFVDNTRWLNNNFNLWYGFSVGYGDLEEKPEIRKQIDNMFETITLRAQQLITEIENNPDLMSKEALENELYNMMKTTNEEGNKLIAENLSEMNAFRIMQASGSKGKAENVGQMMGCIGLQAFEGKLMPKKYNHRTLPYFHQNDDTSESRGLVRSSLYDGLDFVELFFQTVNGRSGLIDQAVKTAETGYMQRKLIKSFEDIMIKYDGTVRNANNTIVQFVYGDSGADTVSQFEYEIGILEMNNEKLEQEHGFTKEELKKFNFSQNENDKLMDQMKKMRNIVMTTVRKAKMNYIAKIKTFMIPINLTRIIELAKENKSNTSNLTPKYIIEKLEEVLSNEKMPLVCMTKKERENKKSFKYQDDQIHKSVLRTALYDALSPKKVIVEYSLDKEFFNEIIEKISTGFIKNLVEPGEMVGVIAATATGEPLTQMNLSSFHQAGVSRTNVGNMGVPRMREVFSVSKNPKAPEMTIFLQPEIRTKKEIYHKIKSNLKHTLFSEIRKRATCYYDPNPSFENGITKKDNIMPVHFTAKGSSKTSCQSEIHHLPFLLRIEIDREKIAEKEIKLVDIVSQFCNWWELRYIDAKNIRKEERRVMNKITQLSVLCNRDNDAEQVIHIRFNARDFEKDKFDLNTVSDFIQYILDKFKLKGINDITETYNYPEDKIVTFNEETGELKQEKEYRIYTAGVNMKEIRYMNGIDLNKTHSNNIVDTYNTFGIEMARSLLMSEISSAYANAGGEVNAQHIEIIVDQMTMSGGITSIDRHGLNKSDADPLSRASFEKPVEQLWTSALFGEIDHMNGVSSRIMVGECIKGGTGYSELILNTDMIEKADYDETEYDKKYEEIKTEGIVSDILKRGGEEEEDVFMPM